MVRLYREAEQQITPPYDSLFNILRNSIPLEKDYSDFENLVQSGASREQALAKLRVDNVPTTGAEKYAYLQNIWDNEHMQPFADFLKWYNNKMSFQHEKRWRK